MPVAKAVAWHPGSDVVVNVMVESGSPVKVVTVGRTAQVRFPVIVEERPRDRDIGRIVSNIDQTVIQVLIRLGLWRLIEKLTMIDPHVVRVLQMDQVAI